MKPGLEITVFENKNQEEPFVYQGIQKVEIIHPPFGFVSPTSSFHKVVKLCNSEIVEFKIPFHMYVECIYGVTLKVETEEWSPPTPRPWFHDDCLFKTTSKEGYLLKHAGEGNFFIVDIKGDPYQFVLHINNEGFISDNTSGGYGWGPIIFEPYQPACPGCARLLPYRLKCRRHTD